MRISVNNGTIRAEDKAGSTAWPLYMDTPGSIKNLLFKNVAKVLKLANAGDPSVDIELLGGSIQVDGAEISPDSIPTHAKAVGDVIYAHDNGIFAELHGLRKLEDVEPKPVTEKRMVDVETREVVSGKLVVTTSTKEKEFQLYDEMEVFDGDGNRIFDKPLQAVDGAGTPLWAEPKASDLDAETGEVKEGYKPVPVMADPLPSKHLEPRMTPGKEVPKAKKDRLAELETIVQNM